MPSVLADWKLEVRKQKQPLVSARIRRVPRTGFSWIDRQFVRRHITHLSRDAILLYFFLAAVSDKNGVSYYGDPAITASLRLSDSDAVADAREELVVHDLLAHKPPLYQVLSLPEPVLRRHGDSPMVIRDIFRQLAEDPPGNTPRYRPSQ